METGAIISQLTDAIKAEIDDLLTDGVVTTSEIVGGIFLTGDQLLGMEQLAVSSGADFINDGGLEINEDRALTKIPQDGNQYQKNINKKKDGTGDVLAGTGLRAEGVEGIITTANGLVGGHLTIGLDTVP